MLDRLLNDVTSRFTMDYKNTQSNDLKQYCEMENIMISSLTPVGKPKSTLKLRLQSVACYLLKRINNWLGSIINRLTADIEQRGKVQRQLS